MKQDLSEILWIEMWRHQDRAMQRQSTDLTNLLRLHQFTCMYMYYLQSSWAARLGGSTRRSWGRLWSSHALPTMVQLKTSNRPRSTWESKWSGNGNRLNDGMQMWGLSSASSPGTLGQSPCAAGWNRMLLSDIPWICEEFHADLSIIHLCVVGVYTILQINSEISRCLYLWRLERTGSGHSSKFTRSLNSAMQDSGMVW